jgi:hypothetical protein
MNRIPDTTLPDRSVKRPAAHEQTEGSRLSSEHMLNVFTAALEGCKPIRQSWIGEHTVQQANDILVLLDQNQAFDDPCVKQAEPDHRSSSEGLDERSARPFAEELGSSL